MQSKVLAEIKSLDSERDHQRIVFLSCRVDFPWDTTRALELALFRSFCIPAISALLTQTGEFEQRSQKRYDDTDIIVSEMNHYRFTEANARIGSATRRLFMSWFPSPVRPLVRRVIHAMLDEPLLNAFGFPHPSPFLRSLVALTMRTRARVVHLLPRRQRPLLRTAMKHPSYPNGYEISKLGPEPDKPPTGLSAPINEGPR